MAQAGMAAAGDLIAPAPASGGVGGGGLSAAQAEITVRGEVPRLWTAHMRPYGRGASCAYGAPCLRAKVMRGGVAFSRYRGSAFLRLVANHKSFELPRGGGQRRPLLSGSVVRGLAALGLVATPAQHLQISDIERQIVLPAARHDMVDVQTPRRAALATAPPASLENILPRDAPFGAAQKTPAVDVPEMTDADPARGQQ